jgi:hypothetical protein
LAWDELSIDLLSDHFTVANLPDRLQDLRKDPWREYYNAKQRITRTMLSALS